MQDFKSINERFQRAGERTEGGPSISAHNALIHRGFTHIGRTVEGHGTLDYTHHYVRANPNNGYHHITAEFSSDGDIGKWEHRVGVGTPPQYKGNGTASLVQHAKHTGWR